MSGHRLIMNLIPLKSVSLSVAIYICISSTLSQTSSCQLHLPESLVMKTTILGCYRPALNSVGISQDHHRKPLKGAQGDPQIVGLGLKSARIEHGVWRTPLGRFA